MGEKTKFLAHIFCCFYLITLQFSEFKISFKMPMEVYFLLYLQRCNLHNLSIHQHSYINGHILREHKSYLMKYS